MSLDEIWQDLDRLEGRIVELRNELAAACQERDRLREENAQLRDERNQVRERIGAVLRRVEQVESQIN